jgi:predicted nucleic acid binding AN1-type Zn finger protein
MSTEEVVYNVDEGPRSVDIFCNWCTETFSYRENGDEAHDFTTCPWCRHRLKIPRNRLRRINGVNPR